VTFKDLKKRVSLEMTQYIIETQKGNYGPRYQCRYKPLEGFPYCIFHLPTTEKKKNTTQFFNELRKIIDQSIKFDLKLFCNGFIFPKIPLGNFLNQTKLQFRNDVLFEHCQFDDSSYLDQRYKPIKQAQRCKKMKTLG
jgi:hypothetical protein